LLKTDDLKESAARAALDLVKDGMRLGLGTGSTAARFVAALGEQVARGLNVVCVPTSEATRVQAERLGIALTTLDETPQLDLTIDGADEIDDQLRMIKGGGGALLREKIVASASKRFVIVADASKVVGRFGRFPLPVEVIQMAVPLVSRRLLELGLRPAVRLGKDGAVYVTDEGNTILDCACGEMDDPAAVAARIRGIVGVVEHGLFLNMADVALIADGSGVKELGR